MRVFEYDIMNDNFAGGREIHPQNSVRFWLDDHSFIEIKPGSERGRSTLEIRAMGRRTQLQASPVSSNTMIMSLKD